MHPMRTGVIFVICKPSVLLAVNAINTSVSNEYISCFTVNVLFVTLYLLYSDPFSSTATTSSDCIQRNFTTHRFTNLSLISQFVNCQHPCVCVCTVYICCNCIIQLCHNVLWLPASTVNKTGSMREMCF